jgi:AIG2-like family
LSGLRPANDECTRPRCLYLAYGSNLHPLRLAARVSSARLVGTAELSGYGVAYVKRGRDGSGKCALTFTGRPGQVAYGAVYEIAAEHRTRLDGFEGLGRGYDTGLLRVSVAGGGLDVFTYLAVQGHMAAGLRPFDWYRDLVVVGARHHVFPETYISTLNEVATRPDPDADRSLEHERLLAEIARYGR